MTWRYIPFGTCSKEIIIMLNGQVIDAVTIVDGCDGNSQALSSLLKGMTIDDALAKIKGIYCGKRNTSCPDQLSIALEQYANSPYCQL